MPSIDELKDRLEIDKTSLDSELSKQPANYLYVSEKAVQSELEYDSFKLKVEQLEVIIDKKIRDEAEAESKKITEKYVEQEIARNPSYREAREKLLQLKAQKEMLRALREAFFMRKDMIIQLAIAQRSEMESLVNSISE